MTYYIRVHILMCFVGYHKPLPMKYVSAKSGKKGSSSGHGGSSKSSMKDQEKILVSVS